MDSNFSARVSLGRNGAKKEFVEAYKLAEECFGAWPRVFCPIANPYVQPQSIMNGGGGLRIRRDDDGGCSRLHAI